MADLEFSVMLGESDALEQVRALVQSFSARKNVRVNITSQNWATAWADLVQAAVHGRGPDLAAISTTWLSDLIGMNVLAPLPAHLKTRAGDKAQYFEGAWLSCFLPDDKQMWALPWFTGTHMLYYRKDWLAQAGLTAETAFASAAALDQTLERLQAHGVERPWAVNTQQRSVSTMHHIYSWVLGAGGHFLAPDGKRVTFAESAALAGMAAYFKLGRFLGPEAQTFTDEKALDLFWQGQAAMVLEGQWILASRLPQAAPEVRDNLGLAVVPGVPFVGGSNLVVWNTTRRTELAWELALHLTSPQTAGLYTRANNLLPARWDVFKASEVGRDSLYQHFAQAINSGRAWPALPHTALIESKLRDIFPTIWAEVLSQPEAEVTAILQKHLEPLQKRLQAGIGGHG